MEITPRLEVVANSLVAAVLAPREFAPDPQAVFPAVGSLHNRYFPLIAVPELYEACRLLRKADRLVYDRGDWPKAEAVNRKANRILHRYGVDCPLPPPEVVSRIVRPKRPTFNHIGRGAIRKRKKLERQRKKRGRM